MSKYTVGEILFATLSGVVVAAFTAIAAFVAAIYICGFLPGERSFSSLLYGPFAAVISGVIAFALIFRWILHYGNGPDAS